MKKTTKFAIEKRSGVYRLQNTITGKFYIGSSRNLYSRYYSHFRLLRENRPDNIRIKEDCLKFGEKSFVFGVVEYCDEKIMKEREQHYYNLWNPEYNIWKTVYSAKGRNYTSDQLKSFCGKMKIFSNPEERSRKLKEAWIKRKEKLSPLELYRKMAEARRGIKHSDETKKMMSERRKGRKKPDGFGDKIRNFREGTKLVEGKFVKDKISKCKKQRSLD